MPQMAPILKLMLVCAWYEEPTPMGKKVTISQQKNKMTWTWDIWTNFKSNLSHNT